MLDLFQSFLQLSISVDKIMGRLRCLLIRFQTCAIGERIGDLVCQRSNGFINAKTIDRNDYSMQSTIILQRYNPLVPCTE